MAIIVAIMGVLLFSTKAVFAKLAYSHGADALTTLALRMLFSLPFYVVIASTLGRPAQKIVKNDYLWLLFFGLIGYYLSSYLDFQGLTLIKAGLERLILFIYPTLVVLISFIILKKPISKGQILGLITTYIGIAIVFVPEVQISDSNATLTGGLLVFMSALSYGSYIVGSGWIMPKFGAKRFTSYAMIVSSLAILLHYFIANGNFISVFNQTIEVYVYCVLMAIFSTVLPSYMISFAIRDLGANRFSIFGSLGPISTIVLAYFFLHEELTLIQLLGGLVVIGGVLVAEKLKAPATK